MDTQAVIELVDELEGNLQDLEANLASLLSTSLATTSKKLPLLDRAKLNVLLVYSIESLLFSYLKLHGVQVKDHPVFIELTRVKQYFAKIKNAEMGPQVAQPTLTLNKDAAARVIRHGLVCCHQLPPE
jgi:exosome complex protein LRP1